MTWSICLCAAKKQPRESISCRENEKCLIVTASLVKISHGGPSDRARADGTPSEEHRGVSPVCRGSEFSGTAGLVAESDGSQHVRCWVESGATRMLIAEYNNPGSECFFHGHAGVEDKPLKSGDKVSGSIRLKTK